MQKTPEELNNLIKQYGNDVYRFCVHLTRNHYEADDLYQDTFLKAIQVSHNLDCSGNIKSYLMGIAINLWKNRVRKNKRRNEIVPQTDFDSFEWGIGEDSNDPLEKCLDSEIKRLLYSAVNKLPEKHRTVVLLHYTQNYTAAEISKILHIPRGTVLSRLAKSREKISNELEGPGYEI